DIEAGHQHVARVVARQLLGPVRPTQCGKWPECRTEPCVQHILVACEHDILSVMRARRRPRLGFGLFDEFAPVRAIPAGNLMPPPKLTRNAPGLDIAHPGEERVFPLLRNEFGLASLDGLDRWLRQYLRVAVPLHC